MISERPNLVSHKLFTKNTITIGLFLLLMATVFYFVQGTAAGEHDLVLSDGLLPIYDGEPGSYNGGGSYGATVAGVGLNGSYGRQLNPDPWHPSWIDLVPPAYRSGIRVYDVVEFYFKVDSAHVANPGDPTFVMGRWVAAGSAPNAGRSNTVYIKNYIEGGVIDDTYRKVTIPLVDLAHENWDLNGVEAFYFVGLDPQSRVFYVDNILLRDVTGPSILNANAETSYIVKISVNEWSALDSIRNQENYAISSETDPNYLTAQRPIEVGAHYRFQTYQNNVTPSSFLNNYGILLRLKEPLKEGHTYSVSVVGITDKIGNSLEGDTEFSFTYTDIKTTDNIKVSQVGYLPSAIKRGFIGGYYGDLGGGIWAVGDGGKVFSYDKHSGWAEQVTPATTTLRGVGGNREDDIWAVGDSGTILNFDGDNWSQVLSPTTTNLNAVYFDEKNIGWAVGDGGLILRYSGGVWSTTTSPTSERLNRIDRDLIVGDNGTILRWDGSTWVALRKFTDENLYGVSGNMGLAVGANGTVLYRKYVSTFEESNISKDTLSNLWDVATNPHNPEVYNSYIVGEGGLLWEANRQGADKRIVDSGTNEDLNTIGFVSNVKWVGGGDNGSLLTIAGPYDGLSSTASSLDMGNIYDIFVLPAGAMRLSKNLPTVQLINVNTGNVAYEVEPVLKSANYFLSGEDVYEFDFSAFMTPGTYKVRVPGVGESYEFEISNDAFNDAIYHTSRYLYYARSGTAIETPYAEERFARPISHMYTEAGNLVDGAFHPSVASSSLYIDEVTCPTVSVSNGGSCPEESYKDVSGGWYDAGDYGKYTSTAVPSVWRLLIGYQLSPNSFDDDNANVPESGNGIPDVLDEAKWELDWLLKMQADDGGVYNKLVANTWEYGGPDTTDLGSYPVRYIMARDTLNTAATVGIFAMASRVWEDIDPTYAATLLSRAELGWEFLEDHPTREPVGGFKNPANHNSGPYPDSDESDERSWAAMELYNATGEAKYKDYFELYGYTGSDISGTFTKGCFGWHGGGGWMDLSLACSYACATTEREMDATIRTACLNNAIKFGSTVRQDENIYPYGSRLDVPEWIGWMYGGDNHESLMFYIAWKLTGEQKYLTAAYLQLYNTIGLNPLSLSFITGIGDKYPMFPLQGQSMFDDVDEPIPGFVASGPYVHLNLSNLWYAGAQSDQNNYPSLLRVGSPYPMLRRYADHNSLVPYNESTILEMAVNYVVFSILGDSAEPQVCTPNWVVSSWSPITCSEGETQTRTYVDINNCGDNSNQPPDETRDCPTVTCTPSWTCGDWSDCDGSTQARTCSDQNSCGVDIGKPIETQSCEEPQVCTPNWIVDSWTPLNCREGETQTRSYIDFNNCGDISSQPDDETRDCPTVACTPSWACGDWSSCVNSTQTRTCSDNNSCGVDTDKPTETQSCNSGGSGSQNSGGSSGVVKHNNNSNEAGREVGTASSSLVAETEKLPKEDKQQIEQNEYVAAVEENSSTVWQADGGETGVALSEPVAEPIIEVSDKTENSSDHDTFKWYLAVFVIIIQVAVVLIFWSVIKIFWP